MQKESFVRRYGLLIGTGLAVGAAAVLLTFLGNPANMGFCIACFLRDIAGALNFQRAGFDADVGTGIVQYIRPEVIGLVLGSTAIAMAKKEFRPKGGSSPMIRFILAVFVMIGALVFLGCPLRMVIRIGGGDLNAVVGLVGFALGIIIGILVLKRGFSLRRAYQQSMAEGLIFPALMLALLALLVLLVSCGAPKEPKNLISKEETETREVNFFSPMEKASPDAENTARTASDLTIAMAEDALGLTVAYRTYTAEDYQDKTYDEVCLERVRSDRDDMYLLNTDAIVALGSEGKLADLSGLSAAANLREVVKTANTVDGKLVAIPQEVVG